MDDYVQNNIPTSVTGFVNDLYYAKSKLLEADTEAERKRGAIGKLCLQSGCDIYIKGVTRGINQENFDECIRGILARSSSLKELSLHKRRFIADNGKQLIRDGMVRIPPLTHPKTILTHGVSRVVRDIIISCKNRKRLTILVTAGGLERDGCVCATLFTVVLPLRTSWKPAASTRH